MGVTCSGLRLLGRQGGGKRMSELITLQEFAEKVNASQKALADQMVQSLYADSPFFKDLPAPTLRDRISAFVYRARDARILQRTSGVTSATSSDLRNIGDALKCLNASTRVWRSLWHV
jgi:hypothetical protein